MKYNKQTLVARRSEQLAQDPVLTSEQRRPCQPDRGHSLLQSLVADSNPPLVRNTPSGTTQSSKISSAVSLPLMPNLSNFWPVEKPSKPFSIIKAVIPLDPFSGAVFAYTTSVDATGPFVILSNPPQKSSYEYNLQPHGGVTNQVDN